ncbi:peptidoglycan editing factor PgeF [Oceanicoccus sagamiensis]|uniref:Purine nucleoside phosphorylase n=1 Tax=Oceanicoccus sagamiensis TaxID=716816 RepID=A0A1X9NB98_9GAMM|nr:peptidoglycan editing factor PgeF [Oceanicoccus sagamiensis]ARN72819.1 hypothetical protein BST96_01080 [Oceanicoccus sagamiensis]
MTVITPDWPAPDNIVALTSTRIGGVSGPPYDSFNVAAHVDDDPAKVEANRQRLFKYCQGIEQIQWLNQTHSATVVNAGDAVCPDADASFTPLPAIACAVMTADCLPLIACDQQGRQIAAIHAGWRGLAGGVIDATMAKFTVPSSEIMVWLGPAISQANFEVGEDVRQQFLQAFNNSDQAAVLQAFRENSHRPGFYFADLYQLARIRLNNLGISAIYGGDFCTYKDSDRFYSYRRDGQTGRMVTLIYKRPD